MAVTKTGSTYTMTESSGDMASISVDVPVDADIAVVFITGFLYNLTKMVYYAQFDGSDSTKLATAYQDDPPDDPTVEVWYHVNPPTGTVTFRSEVGAGGGAGQGFTWVVAFFTGVDTTDPIVDSSVDETWDGNAAVGSLTGVSPGDMSLGVAYASNQTPDADPAGFGQTALNESLFNSAGCGVAMKAGESALEIDGTDTVGGVFFALKATATGSSYTNRRLRYVSSFRRV